mmetsp:Transcript_3449/g.11480  ORF Transcript_3449/g.11480 Transcript_3449/m.11480 type:complete len:325 (-) Transcript_3449:906-1880(-)
MPAAGAALPLAGVAPFAAGTFLGVAPYWSTRMPRRWATSSASSSAGTAFSNLLPSSGCSPTLPPRKMCTPSTAMFLPVSGSTRFAGEPMRPMSPTWAWPHELGHPVQCIRTSLGRSSCASRASATRTARCLVSIMATGQNWLPVHETRPRMMELACSTRRRPWVRAGSARRASTRSAGTLGRITFCSTVSRSSPPVYSSARSASARISAADRRPTGTVTPTHLSPGCFWSCTPMRSLRSQVPSAGGAASSKGFTPRRSMACPTVSVNHSIPFSSMSHMSRVFWRSPREPWSRNTSRMARHISVASSAGTHLPQGTDSAYRLMEK